MSWAGTAWAGAAASSEAPPSSTTWGGDPLAYLGDDFSSGATLTGRGWGIEDTVPTSAPSDLITLAEADLTVNGGGVGGSFWFDPNDGALWYKTITGPFDVRARVRVRNTADTGLPPTTQFRIAGLAAHDPDRTTMEYLHAGLGGDNTGAYREEWKTTDNDDSAYAYQNATLTGGELLYDLRIVRYNDNAQEFGVFFRAGTTVDLDSDVGWGAWPVGGIDREDILTPDRVANNGSAAVALPQTLRVGFIVYASTATHDIRMFASDFQIKLPDAR